MIVRAPARLSLGGIPVQARNDGNDSPSSRLRRAARAPKNRPTSPTASCTSEGERSRSVHPNFLIVTECRNNNQSAEMLVERSPQQ